MTMDFKKTQAGERHANAVPFPSGVVVVETVKLLENARAKVKGSWVDVKNAFHLVVTVERSGGKTVAFGNGRITIGVSNAEEEKDIVGDGVELTTGVQEFQLRNYGNGSSNGDVCNWIRAEVATAGASNSGVDVIAKIYRYGYKADTEPVPRT